MKLLGKLFVVASSSAAIAAATATAASSPTVSTGSASHIKQTSAVLGGTVNPNGARTSYYFQWGLTNGYGVSGRVHSAGSGTSAVSVQETASGLIPGTTYHYRLVAVSRYGTTAGKDRKFTTAGHPPPGAETGPATGVGPTFATLTGVINPHGQTTSWTFAYGTTTAYGSFTAGGTVAAGSSPMTVASAIKGLAPGTIFHYQLIAKHGSTVVSRGADQIFMTHPTHPAAAVLRARTRPHHARHRPFTFTTSGRVIGPSSIPAQFACSGDVAIRFFRGKRRIAFILVPVQPNCTFSGQAAFGPRLGSRRRVRLRVRVRYRGNGYLAAARAHPKTVIAS